MAQANSYNAWRKQVLERDGQRCVLCGATEKLEADHIKPRATAPELRLEVDNGRTLCQACHRKSDTYGGNMRRGKKMDRNPYGPR